MPFDQIATRSGLPLKAMIDGPSGSGKTVSALKIAAGIVTARGGEIAVLDTQNGQSKRYAGDFRFFCEIIRQYDPDTFIRYIRDAERAKMAALVMDSATHEWSYILSLVDSLSNRGGANNAWREATPVHKRFVEAIIQATIPIIVTVRTKTDWLYVEEKRGNRNQIVPHKVGTKPEQRDQFEFEFDLWLRMDRSNHALVEKSVFPFLPNGTDVGKPDETIGTRIVEWFEGTTFDAEAELEERDRHERASGSGGRGSETTRRRAEGPAPTGSMMVPTDALDEGDGADDEDSLGEDDPENGDEASDESEDADETRRQLLIDRYRTLVAVMVMKRAKDSADWVNADIVNLTEAELLGYIETLEKLYPNVKQTGAYQCDVCGKKIYPHKIEEFKGSSFPGLQLIALSVKQFKRALCAEDLARERTKARRRS